METRELIELRNTQWAAFQAWEDAQPLQWREPSAILADLSAIWNWFPIEVRLTDPEKKGVQAMHAALAHLKPSYK